ncbi:hypothetical protein [Streptococcus equi]|uniref:hypothetical protein n=1 Tax=Streptococcus equi TaxID=1336 RepID=UPI0013F64929|nr:hypothetical protein [Streptococcus equi]MDI5990278.1 hypothetical protein [Streptococcus equi subsp. zooepidemicus]
MRSHTVILGAGATIAAIPKGDKNGKSSSVMNGLLKKLNLEELLSDVELRTKSENLEDIYSELYERAECAELVKELEERLYAYFASLELPDEPTIYDLLILSLTDKDCIATFNWDPLLIQAYVRCSKITQNLPHILCLHGNVGVGFCEEHVEFGTLDYRCPQCRNRFNPTKLLYPVKNKNYSSDKYINWCWRALEFFIDNSYMLTIFGYSAPKSDVEAVNLMKKAWGTIEDRQLEEVSVIDIVDEESMLNTWSDFIHTHHYRYSNSFFDSYLAKFPRRTCETVFATFSLNVPSDGNRGFKENFDWEDIKEYIADMLVEEMGHDGKSSLKSKYLIWGK